MARYPFWWRTDSAPGSGEPLWGDAIGPYHRWFAWRPVETWNCGWRWLRFVYRRRCQTKPYLDGPMLQWWQYMLPREQQKRDFNVRDDDGQGNDEGP